MENGARSAAILAAQLRAGDGATDAQKAKIAELTGRLYDMKNGTESAGKSTNGFRNALQQGGYQVQDFIVQVQSGQSALVAFSQQVFGTLFNFKSSSGYSTILPHSHWHL